MSEAAKRLDVPRAYLTGMLMLAGIVPCQVRRPGARGQPPKVITEGEFRKIQNQLRWR